MSQQLAIVQTIYEAFGKGDIPTLLSHLADDVRWEEWADHTAQKAGVPWMQLRQGKAEVMGFFQVIGGFNLKDFHVLSLMEGGNQVVVEVVIEAEVPATHGHYRDEELHLWTFNAQGKIARLRHYTDTAKHIAAARGNP